MALGMRYSVLLQMKVCSMVLFLYSRSSGLLLLRLVFSGIYWTLLYNVVNAIYAR